jgi:hypothetical protein
MKPEHTRPFDLAAAKAGAPYCCRSGQEATVLKWDCKNDDYPLVGISGSEDSVELWTTVGNYTARTDDPQAKDLVMLPLGFCEGKPVFAGDELIGYKTGNRFKVAPGAFNLDGCCWPLPKPSYPESAMNVGQLCSAYYAGGSVSAKQEIIAFKRIANAAIRHALDAGQVVLPRPPSPATSPPDDDPAEFAYWRFDARVKGDAEWRGRPQSERDAFKAEYRIAMADGAKA